MPTDIAAEELPGCSEADGQDRRGSEESASLRGMLAALFSWSFACKEDFANSVPLDLALYMEGRSSLRRRRGRARMVL